jgi:hypothetical protein
LAQQNREWLQILCFAARDTFARFPQLGLDLVVVIPKITLQLSIGPRLIRRLKDLPFFALWISYSWPFL